MDLGKTIKDYRVRKGYKQNEFAEKCGLTQAYLSKIENNQKEPTLAVLKTIAGALQLPLPILFFVSMTAEDVDPKKKEAYQMIESSIKGMVENFF
ncbi:helix-turn-helix protein [Anseongella ginsenosidimutans]|uniref:Helix-turn-helix protein n=1 Tax=Anseongella ginsenosidimutans TaxID=496056 RepID=A0A4R3KLM4_9SPHI|nr:helix-turn-helix transcriptional regulator [Anseongella ginsenosidimutans]QEC51950.1 helix-turn-helix transcriptional regulator [Anseongella ginsenosidimutans]TCS84734.1 helix-turn-helix protein [Anseongella ginsenosidimutans]